MRFHVGNVPGTGAGPSEADGWHRIHSPGSCAGYFLAGLAGILFFAVLFLWLIVVSFLTTPSPTGSVEETAPGIVVLLAVLLHVPLHELLHAAWHPRWGLSPQTVLVVWPARLHFGVYYDGCMTRRRWLAMRLAPLVFLSFLPAALLTVSHLAPLPFAVQIFLQVVLLANSIGSGADLIAVLWVLRQVAPGGQICFVEGKAYWRRPSPVCSRA